MNKIKTLEKRIEYLEEQIDCACNALTDSICVSGNDFETNLFWVRKLRQVIKKDENSDSYYVSGIGEIKIEDRIDVL